MPVRFTDRGPLASSKRAVIPSLVREAQIGVPRHADPIQLQALDLELSSGVLQVETGAGVFGAIQEPVDGIDFGADIDGVRFEPVSG